jgi:SAM-dependent methyltransferase
LTTARELYQRWAGEAEHDERLGESLGPRGKDWLFELFASLGPKEGDFVLDIGARDGRSFRRLVEEHGVTGVAVDPVPTDPEVVEGAIESLPLDDATVDWIWARDMLVHVDLERAFAECARVLRPGGRIVAYVTHATDLLEPKERAWFAEALAFTNMDTDRFEAAPFELEQKHVLGSEWRERMIEDGEWDTNDALLRFSRMRRQGIDDPVHGADLVYGVYQLLGKLEPTVYVWRKP